MEHLSGLFCFIHTKKHNCGPYVHNAFFPCFALFIKRSKTPNYSTMRMTMLRTERHQTVWERSVTLISRKMARSFSFPVGPSLSFRRQAGARLIETDGPNVTNSFVSRICTRHTVYNLGRNKPSVQLKLKSGSYLLIARARLVTYRNSKAAEFASVLF